MGFPPTLSYPPKISPKQAWKLLGNSLNVQVVAVLLAILIHSPEHPATRAYAAPDPDRGLDVAE